MKGFVLPASGLEPEHCHADARSGLSLVYEHVTRPTQKGAVLEGEKLGGRARLMGFSHVSYLFKHSLSISLYKAQGSVSPLLHASCFLCYCTGSFLVHVIVAKHYKLVKYRM